MAAPLSLVWDLIAVDHASGTFGRVGASADVASSGVKRLLEGLGLIAAGGAIAGAVKAAADFQSSMLLIQTQAHDTTDNLGQMSKAVLQLAGQTAQAPEALALSLYHVTSTGVRGAQALDEVRAAAQLATVSHSNLEDTTNALTSAIASGIPGVQNMTQAIGVLNATVGSGDMKMSDLNEALSTGLLTNIRGYGLSIQDVGAALATFGDVNVRGADAATQLRMAVQAMAVPVRGGQAVLNELGITQAQVNEGMGKLHLSASQLATDMSTGGLNKAVTDLHDHLQAAGISADQMGTVLTEAFGKRAGPGLANLLTQFDRLQQKYKDVNAEGSDFGTEWSKTQQTASFAFNSLKGSLSALAIELGSHLLPPLADAAHWLSQHSELVKNLVLGVGALTAGLVIYRVTVLAVKAATEAWAAIQAILDAELDANPIGLIVLALAALVTGIIYAYNHSKAFRDIVDDLGKAFGRLYDAIKWAVEHIVTMFDNLKRAFGDLATFIGKGLSSLGTQWKNFAVQMFDDWQGPGSGQAVIDLIRASFRELPRDMEALKNGLPTLWHKMWTQIHSDYSTGSTGGSALFTKIKADLSDFTKSFLTAFTQVNRTFGQAFLDIRQAWRNWIEPFFTLAGDTVAKITKVIGAGWDSLRTKWSQVWGDISKLWSGPGGGAETHAKAQQAARDTNFAESSAWTQIESVVGQALDGMKRAWDTVGSGLMASIKAGAGDLAKAFDSSLKNIQSGFDGLWTGVERMLNQLMIGINDTVIAGFNKLAAAVGSSARLQPLPLIGVTLVNSGGNPSPLHGPMALGGVIAGYAPGVDSVHALLSPGEGVLVPEAVMGLGGARGIHALNAAFSPRVPRFASGGVVGDITGLLSNPVGYVGGQLDQSLASLGGSPLAQILDAIPHYLLNTMGGWVNRILGSAQGAAPGAPTLGGSLSHLGAVLIGQAMAAARGWTGSEWNALYALWTRESGWNANAVNPSSGAYGIPQSLGHGHPYNLGDAAAQIAWGLNYISGRFGDPATAWAHEVQFGWYRNGTNYVPGDGPAWLHKGEAVVPASANQGSPWQGANVTVIAQFGDETIEATAVRVVDSTLGFMANTVYAASPHN